MSGFDLLDFEIEYHWENEIDEKDNYYEIKSYIGLNKVIEIPKTILGTKVNVISEEILMDNDSVKILILSKFIKSLDFSKIDKNKKLVVYTESDENEIEIFNKSDNIIIC